MPNLQKPSTCGLARRTLPYDIERHLQILFRQAHRSLGQLQVDRVVSRYALWELHRPVLIGQGQRQGTILPSSRIF